MIPLWKLAICSYAAAAKSLLSCLTLCDPRDGSPPGSPVPRILQARTLEWVAISFSNAWKWKMKVKSLSRVRPSATPWTAAFQAPPSMDFPGKSTGVGCHCLLRFVPIGMFKSGWNGKWMGKYIVLLFSSFFERYLLKVKVKNAVFEWL